MNRYEISRRQLLKGFGIGAAGLVVAACAPAAAPAPGAGGDSDVAAETASLNALFPSGNALQEEYYADVTSRFTEETGIEAAYSTLPFEKLMDKELMLVAAGSSDVDIFGTHYAQIGRFIEALTPLNEFAERDGIEGSQYVDGAFSAFSHDSNLLAIPLSFDLRALYYRTDLFEAAGIEAPPTTWDELVETGKAINNPPEVYGYLIVGKGDPALREFSDILWENGGDFLEDGLNPSPPAWNKPEGVQALQWWYDLVYTHEIAPPGVPSYGWEELNSLWVTGQAGMSKQWGAAASQDPDGSTIVDSFGIAPLVGNKTNTTTAVCHGRGINVYSEQVDASWELVKYLTSEAELVNMYNAAGGRPANLDALGQVVEAAEGIDRQGLEASLAGAENGYTWPLFPEFSEVQPILWGEIEKVLSGQKSPQEGLDFAAEEALKIFQRAELV